MQIRTKAKWTLASAALRDAFTDFVLSRQAANCSPATISFYGYTCGTFLTWLEGQGVTQPNEVTARHIRQFIAGLTGKADNTVHDFARGIRTLLRFWHAEKYMPDLITFDMPKVAQKRLPILTVDELRQVLTWCTPRDKALVLLMVDSGLRRAEVVALNWEDLDFSNGLLRVKRGKGGKARSSVVGATTRRALLALRREYLARKGLKPSLTGQYDYLVQNSPMFQSNKGGRLSPWGLGLIFQRLTRRTGVHVTAHALRRTFVTLSLRAGMDIAHLQALGGWSDLTMLVHYAQMTDEDLLQGHAEHSPIDRL